MGEGIVHKNPANSQQYSNGCGEKETEPEQPCVIFGQARKQN